MKKICYVATIPAVVHSFLRVHIQAAAEKYDVTVICNETDKYLLEGLNAHIIFLPITRNPSLWNDMMILFRLFSLFRREKFDIVHSIMPKTGILSMLGAWLARIPVRIHTFTGQVWVTKYGIKRFLLKWFDTLIGNFATCVFIDSPSQRDFLVNENVLSKEKTTVIGAGSICGVDTQRFVPNAHIREKIRNELEIAHDSKVILYVGRLNRDKGILDLATAFEIIANNCPRAVLLLVGTEEDVSFNQIQEICRPHTGHLHYIPFSSTPEHYMAAADIFCLPSYREGFGMTIIEAAACEIPTVASCIYGITDAVDDGTTGVLFTAGDTASLTQVLLRLINNQDLCREMGKASRKRALELFESQLITKEMLSAYEMFLK
ncbi:MAG: glycosyltransferase family 4 protein [Sulfuricurvum sp.]|nr:glycosyltransferase family 4 protein [Sulfuricurvum sp.]